jgi:hypothetical protein
MHTIDSRSRSALRWESDGWLLYAFVTAGIGGAFALVTWWG